MPFRSNLTPIPAQRTNKARAGSRISAAFVAVVAFMGRGWPLLVATKAQLFRPRPHSSKLPKGKEKVETQPFPDFR